VLETSNSSSWYIRAGDQSSPSSTHPLTASADKCIHFSLVAYEGIKNRNPEPTVNPGEDLNPWPLDWQLSALITTLSCTQIGPRLQEVHENRRNCILNKFRRRSQMLIKSYCCWYQILFTWEAAWKSLDWCLQFLSSRLLRFCSHAFRWRTWLQRLRSERSEWAYESVRWQLHHLVARLRNRRPLQFRCPTYNAYIPPRSYPIATQSHLELPLSAEIRKSYLFRLAFVFSCIEFLLALIVEHQLANSWLCFYSD